MGVVKTWQLDEHRAKIPIDHPDLSIPRAKLEYPTADVDIPYLAHIGKLWYPGTGYTSHILTSDSFADKAVEVAGMYPDVAAWLLMGRLSDVNNHYDVVIDVAATTADMVLRKLVAGVATSLASEAVDLTAGVRAYVKLSISGSTLAAYRASSPSYLPATPNISATDTSLTSGHFGGDLFYNLKVWTFPILFFLRSPSSPSPKPIAYFEVPIVGSGTQEDPYRAKMPEEIVWEWSLNPTAKRKYDILKAKGFTDDEIVQLFPEVLSCRVNRLALTHSSLIPTGKDGKPIHGTAIVRVFEQTDRLAYMKQAIASLKAIPGVRELTRDEAISMAMRMDDKLHILDLSPCTHAGECRCLKDYIEWRIATLGVKPELIDENLMARYVKEVKW